MNSKGVIYILVNPAFPHLIKIGYTDNLKVRVKNLNSNSGIPADFHVYAVYETSARLEDIKIHEIIDTLDPTLRYNKKREFYEMSPEKAYKLLECIATINGLQSGLIMNPLNDSYITDIIGDKETASGKAKRTPMPAFRFDMVGIVPGEELTFVDDDSVKVTVDDDLKHVIYNGSRISMSALAQKLLSSKYPVQGTLYFTYQGKRLTDLRAEQSEI